MSLTIKVLVGLLFASSSFAAQMRVESSSLTFKVMATADCNYRKMDYELEETEDRIQIKVLVRELGRRVCQGYESTVVDNIRVHLNSGQKKSDKMIEVVGADRIVKVLSMDMF